jgi:hypothetical protein
MMTGKAATPVFDLSGRVALASDASGGVTGTSFTIDDGQSL